MKKHLAAATVLLLLLVLCTVPCAAKQTADAVPGNQDINVYAQTIYTSDPNTAVLPPDDGGKYQDDDVPVVVVPDTPHSDYWLVVHRVNKDETEAYRWFESATASLSSPKLYYEIYFIDAFGQRVDGGSAQVTVSLPGTFGTTRVYTLSTQEQYTELPATQQTNTLTFTMIGNGYYVLSGTTTDDGGTGGGTGGSGGSGGSGGGSGGTGGSSSGGPVLHSPKTADESAMALWACLAGGSLLTLLALQRRKKATYSEGGGNL